MRLGRAVAFLVERTGLRARLQEIWRRDIARSVAAADRHTEKSVAKLTRLADEGGQVDRVTATNLRALENQVAASMAVVREFESRLTRLEQTALADSRQAPSVAEWQSRFRSGAICAHVTRAVSEAPLLEEPAAHLLVERISSSRLLCAGPRHSAGQWRLYHVTVKRDAAPPRGSRRRAAPDGARVGIPRHRRGRRARPVRARPFAPVHRAALRPTVRPRACGGGAGAATRVVRSARALAARL